MANYSRKMIVHGDHLVAPETGPPWTVLWDTTARLDGHWSTVRVQSEAAALERAAHFVMLGFVVHAIKDPSGIVVMNEKDIAGRFGPTEKVRSHSASESSARSAEQTAHDILRSFVEDYRATPGRMLAASALHALPSQQGVDPAEFERAVSYAKEHGWLRVADGTLTLTQAGYAAATA
ncbi:MAG TPA: hypothetical protein VJ770_28160 [Stellaceae bacterium]|nr:hypothetical protein [Stellaceae bacterium]